MSAGGDVHVTGDQRLRAARRVAARLVEAHGLTPAIDVEALVDEHATRHVAQLPVAGDLAVLTAAPAPSGGVRPAVIEQPRLAADPRRRRVALAHALAHVALSWHVGCSSCTLGGGVDLPDQWNGDSSVRGTAEAEADAFSMQLLLPATWLRDEVVGDSPVDAIVRAAALGDVPLAFAAAAVARQLDAGVVWTISDSWQTVRHAGCAPATLASVPSIGVELDDAQLTGAARRSERRTVAGLVLQAWVLDQPTGRAVVGSFDHVPSEDVLADIARDLRLSGGRGADLRAAINGVVGSAWGGREHDTAFELEQVLHDRFADIAVAAHQPTAHGMAIPSTYSGRNTMAGALAATQGTTIHRAATTTRGAAPAPAAARSQGTSDLLDAAAHPAFTAFLQSRAAELYARRRV